ncbi:metal-dependent hydrolase [Herbaspirillum sp. meg3]|uniref:metal-dependent hydrolase n=1 Tax=Herbaspirillum sp. meg3 TaxID=2025949 RepID=UPI000B99A1F8|nr:metal-dependent hydrolase [Herbaspirillum sp. meg3]ASU39503.1 metal-dependent hydrolase [Herbaspirillum sp. meg3]
MTNSRTDMLVRKLDVDLKNGFPRHWHGGDAFRSMYYNALSMSFPAGEQFFIDAVRAGSAILTEEPDREPLRELIRQFIGQEASHRHLHHVYNTRLEEDGMVNHWQHWARRRIEWTKKKKLHPLNLLAVTIAYEHFTAVFADITLRHPDLFDAAEQNMQTLWRWHASEEIEHKAVAFDLYRALGGGYARRQLWYVYVVLMFVLEAALQTASNLWRTGSLFKPSTWWSAATFLFGRKGSVWCMSLPLMQYFRPGFHPDDDDNRHLAAQWLKTNEHAWRRIGA